MNLPIAEISTSSSMVGWGVLLSLALNAVQLLKLFNGTDGQRQVEPTAIASIQTSLETLQDSLGDINREMGEVTSSVADIRREIGEYKTTHRDEIAGIHHRMGGISRELAAATALLTRAEVMNRERAER
jgi:uncharacterized protein YlxW (UPF0749 family)